MMSAASQSIWDTCNKLFDIIGDGKTLNAAGQHRWVSTAGG